MLMRRLASPSATGPPNETETETEIEETIEDRVPSPPPLPIIADFTPRIDDARPRSPIRETSSHALPYRASIESHRRRDAATCAEHCRSEPIACRICHTNHHNPHQRRPKTKDRHERSCDTDRTADLVHGTSTDRLRPDDPFNYPLINDHRTVRRDSLADERHQSHYTRTRPPRLLTDQAISPEKSSTEITDFHDNSRVVHPRTKEITSRLENERSASELGEKIVSRSAKRSGNPEPRSVSFSRIVVPTGKNNRHEEEAEEEQNNDEENKNKNKNENQDQNQDRKRVRITDRTNQAEDRVTNLVRSQGDDSRFRSDEVENKIRKKSGQRSRSGWSDEKYRFFFLLYLLALPILCATNGSLPVAAALAFPKTTDPRNNLSMRNGSTTLDGIGKDREYGNNNKAKNATRGHPYAEYSWEVNQINPWLSACDLAGPAPADLQGSCGPPETPKNCPQPCGLPRETTSTRDSDLFSAVVSQAADYAGSRWSISTATSRATTNRSPYPPRTDTGERLPPEQCLFYLEESHKRDICRDGFGENSSHKFSTVEENRYRFLSGLRLRHCCEHAALNALASGKGGPLEEVLAGGNGCTLALDKLLAVDALAARLHCEFGEVLARYDCGQQYSVIYNCSHCKEAYRRWVCSSLVPYFAHDDPPHRKKNDEHGLPGSEMITGMRIRPCRSFCQTVEQRCPYLLPGDRAPAYPTQYAGEPTFLCRDPNIPETGEQASRALHADEECCFRVCSDNDPGLGVCSNCTKPEVEIAIRGGNPNRDPSTAPQCELSPSIPQGSSPGSQQPSTSSGSESRATTESGVGSRGESGADQDPTSSPPPASAAGSFCGSGGVGSMTSRSSPRTSAASIPPLILCAFCAWGVLVSTCTIKTTSPLRALFNISRVTMTKCVKCGLTVIKNWSNSSIGAVRLSGWVTRPKLKGYDWPARRSVVIFLASIRLRERLEFGAEIIREEKKVPVINLSRRCETRSRTRTRMKSKTDERAYAKEVRCASVPPFC